MSGMTASVHNGERLCREIREKFFKDGQEYIVFLFSKDMDINYHTLRLLPFLRKQENVTEFLIVEHDPNMDSMIQDIASVPYTLEHCSETEAHDIGRYCTEITRGRKKSERLLINGTDDMEEYRYEGLIGINGITAEGITAMSVFDLDRIPDQQETDEAMKYIPKTLRDGMSDMVSVWETEVADLGEWEAAITDGRRIYGAIRCKYPDTRIYMCTYPGTGDMYLTGLYLKDRMKHDNVSECVMVVASETGRKIIGLFDMGDVIKEIYVLKGRQECNKLLFYVRNMGFDAANAGLLSNDYGVMRLERMSGVNGIDFNTMFQKVVFFSDIKRTYAGMRQESAEGIFDNARLRPGKTVLLSPYANTTTAIRNEIWIDIADKLIMEGYDVATNVSGMSEVPISGTIGVEIPYTKIVAFLDKAGGFIGLRSGLCDIISGSSTRKVVLYPAGVHFHRSTSLNYFSLKKMYDIEIDLWEIEVGDDEDELVERILEPFRNRGR